MFGYTEERRSERALIEEYRSTIERLLGELSADKLGLAVEIARVPERIRGYGHVKETHLEQAKKLREALQQLAEEGVVQLFVPHDGSGSIVGVVGALQLDVLKERLSAEYSLPIDYEQSRFSVCRWVESADERKLDEFMTANRSAMADDLDGAPVFLAPSAFSLRYDEERWPQIRFTDVKDYQKKAA